jgi:serine/threonine protein kinase
LTTPLHLCVSCGALVAQGVRICAKCHALQPERDSVAPQSTIERDDGRIVIETRIGEGGMGVVWRGWLFRPPGHPGGSAPEPLALKMLRPQASVHGDARELFRREAETLRRLSHPNVVGFFDLFEHQATLVLAIEYVDGDTLEAIIARHVARARAGTSGGLPGMPLLRAWYYFQQLLGALAAIHALGIVHRDVKPSNVLVRRDGIVKLGDFGIARFADAAPTHATTMSAPGTGAYMSPEQVTSKPLSGRSDLYSAACVLFEMLAGRPPFPVEGNEFMVRAAQVSQSPPALTSLVPQAPPVLDALFARALAKDPAARFEGAIEMGDAFRSAAGLPDTREWRAQADMARVAKTVFDAAAPKSGVVEAQKKFATLKEFVAVGYKTMKMASG